MVLSRRTLIALLLLLAVSAGRFSRAQTAASEDAVARAAALVNQGRHADAARAYEALTAGDPGNPSLQLSLGLCYQSLREYEKAAGSLEKAARLAADPVPAAYSLALVREALSREPTQADRRGEHRAAARAAWRTVAARGSGDKAAVAARHLERLEEEDAR